MTTATRPKSHGADTIKTIPRPDEPIPAIVLPTIALFLGALVVWLGSAALGLTGTWPAILSVMVSGVAAFVMFTVVHECSHVSASSSHAFNLWLGRIATPFFTIIGSFSLFRFIHMQHHRFTNHTDGSDPDHYTQRGPGPLLALRWATLDINYLRFYMDNFGQRPRGERIEFAVTTLVVWSAIVALCLTGHALDVLLFYIIPARIAMITLAWSFDWLPHHQLPDTIETNKFRATRNTVGMEWLLTPLLLYQNYHLVHHLHPRIPFHRYIKVWRRNEQNYLANDPALATPTGRPVTVEEYRQLRHLEDHH